MKKIFTYLLLCAAVAFTACEKNETENDPTVTVSSITLSELTLGLVAGQSKTLTAAILPDNATHKEVVWSSDDEKIATVSAAGVVTGVSAGSTTITVLSAEDNAIKAQCTVTVSAKEINITKITLDTQTLGLIPGQSKTLKATTEPSNATNTEVVWKSGDEKIATVSQKGIVTGTAVGETTITVMSAADNSIKASCTVTVSAQEVKVTGITLDAETLSLVEGETKTLKATITPDNATNTDIVWNSGNETVATVSQSGIITAMKAGKATITVTSAEDSSIQASCAVTVSAQEIRVTDMMLDTYTLEIKVSQSQTLKATVIPTEATNQNVIWSSDNESVATVSQIGVVTGKKVGTATITVMSAADNSKKEQCAVTVLTTASYTVGDLYPDAVNPIGVVFWKDPANTEKGKIISLSETKTEWAEERVIVGASDKDDGAVNMAKVKTLANWETLYPAFKWCADKGTGWYLPSENEVKEIFKTRDTINKSMEKTDEGVKLDENGTYWTSTEHSNTPKHLVLVIPFKATGGTTAAGATDYFSKDNMTLTRAVLNF